MGADTKFMNAHKLYKEGDFLEALKLFQEVNRDPKFGGPGSSSSLNVARCFHELGDLGEALNNYQEFLANHKFGTEGDAIAVKGIKDAWHGRPPKKE